ncbi:MAG: hypothetical protein PUP93_26555 [Rhizonema sp. NSF051]|nr:hypothetical protein [Rhizonema sp. NSF051]
MTTTFLLTRNTNWFLKMVLVAIASLSFFYLVNNSSKPKGKHMTGHKQNPQPNEYQRKANES